MMIPVRDDSNARSSLSNVERDFLLRSASQKRRIDGRTLSQVRSHSIQLVRWDNGSSATVTWGGSGSSGSTRVACTCAGSVVPPPSADLRQKNEGVVSIGVDLSPSASTSFRYAQPQWNTPQQQTGGQGQTANIPSDSTKQKLLSNQILRGLERIILMSGTIDTEALCVVPGAYVWKLQLVVTVMDASGGNLFDACCTSCIAALRHYRLPHLDLGGGDAAVQIPKLIGADYKEPTPLPLHHVPLSASFALLQVNGNNSSNKNTNSSDKKVVAYMIDPNSREEMVAVGCINLAMNVHGEICYFDYGGGCEIDMRRIKECHDIASGIIKQHCISLEQTLKQADEQSKIQRLHRLQQQQQQGPSSTSLGLPLPPPPPTTFDKEPPILDGIPYFAEQEVPVVVEQKQDGDSNIEVLRRQREEEEMYRQRALDYNVGHRATQLKQGDNENDPSSKRSAASVAEDIHQKKNSLLEAMLQSVLTTTTTSPSASTPAPATAEKKNEAATETPEPVPMDVEEDVKEVSTERKNTANKTAATARTTAAAAGHDHHLDSDEEETTLQLTSEYASTAATGASAPAAVSQPPATTTLDNANANNAAADEDDGGDDGVDDLAAAIKTKKKKKSKKGKKN